MILVKPFTRMSVFDAILHHNENVTAEQLNNMESATALAETWESKLKESWDWARSQIEIFEETVEHLLKNPTFITEYRLGFLPWRRNDK